MLARLLYMKPKCNRFHDYFEFVSARTAAHRTPHLNEPIRRECEQEQKSYKSTDMIIVMIIKVGERVYNTPSKKISIASEAAGRSPPLTRTFLEENQQFISNTTL